MAKLKLFDSLTGNAAERAEARASKLSAQLAEIDRDLEASETRRATERKALAEALGNGQDADRPEAALVEIAATVARLSERRAVLVGLVETATAAAAEARRASGLGAAREALEEARMEAVDAERKAVAAFVEAQKVAGRFAEAVQRCGSASASLHLLDPEADFSAPSTLTFPFAVERAIQDEGLRRIGTQNIAFHFLT